MTADSMAKEKGSVGVVRVQEQRKNPRALKFSPMPKKKRDGGWCRAPELGAREKDSGAFLFWALIGALLELDFSPLTLKTV